MVVTHHRLTLSVFHLLLYLWCKSSKWIKSITSVRYPSLRRRTARRFLTYSHETKILRKLQVYNFIILIFSVELLVRNKTILVLELFWVHYPHIQCKNRGFRYYFRLKWEFFSFNFVNFYQMLEFSMRILNGISQLYWRN